jgi:glucose/arabinose dehydrogenase
MCLAPGGVLFVGTRDEKVYAVVPGRSPKDPRRVVTIAQGLHEPNGVAFKDGALYVAEVSRVLRYDRRARLDRQARPALQPAVVNDRFPTDEHHGWKYIRFGTRRPPLRTVGVACNVCDEKDPYGTMMRMKPDGSALEIYARGIRNTVGFDWNPADKALWFTDNGRDMMGDDVPPDELNAVRARTCISASPTATAGRSPIPRYGKQRKCSDFTPPAINLGPHVAALGMRFYTGTMFPSEYKSRIFIAEHGSWNRTHKIGYRVMSVKLEGGRAVSYDVFAEGWLEGERAWGRPVDVQVLADGSLLVSDDSAGAIYRIA